VNIKPVDHLSEEKIKSATQQFIGEIQQIPPAHSAIKVGGKRLYELAREGKEVKPEPRTVTIKEFIIEKIDPIAFGLQIVHFKVVCTTGTYIRSLAYDFGEALGCGAFLSSLCRTRIGDFSVTDAQSLEEIQEKVKQELL